VFFRSTGHRLLSWHVDAAAVGALSALRELGVDVPGQVAVAGFDDVPMARYVSPPLTSVRVHIEQLGARAAAVLLDALGASADGSPDGTGARVRELLPTAVVVRASCGAEVATERPPPDESDALRAAVPVYMPIPHPPEP